MNTPLAPYNIANDNAVLLLFLLNLAGTALVFTRNGKNIKERMKQIFLYGKRQAQFNDRMHITRSGNLLLHIQTISYSTILAASFLQERGIADFTGGSWFFLGISFVFFTAVILIKYAGYYIVNSILFAKRAVKEWQQIYFFTIKMLGFTFAPAVIAILFIPAIPSVCIKIYLGIILIAYLYIVISNIIKIIFTRNINILDIFLYLCTLEFLPMLFVWNFILQLNEFITIKI